MTGNINQTLALFGSILIVFSNIPQIIRLIKRKKSDDVSAVMFAMLSFAMLFLFNYAYRLEDMVLMFNYGSNLVMFLTVLFLVRKYR